MKSNYLSICDVPGILVGHVHDDVGKTGCTVIIPEKGAVAGVDIRGSAPGTREIETIRMGRLIPKVDAVLLTGGSAFGLDAAGGVQQFLEEKKVGFDVGVTTVPIVPTAVIFDLHEGDHTVRPDKAMGYAAAQNASRQYPGEGRIGVGRGATVGKLLGPANAMKGGMATLSTVVRKSVVGVLVVVNAVGDIVEGDGGKILAGAVDPDSGRLLDSEKYLLSHSVGEFPARANTTLAVVATDARLNKEEATQLARMAQCGFARAIRPAHTPFDGDLCLVLSLGQSDGDVTALGSAATNLIAESIRRAARAGNHDDQAAS